MASLKQIHKKQLIFASYTKPKPKITNFATAMNLGKSRLDTEQAFEYYS